ncbi:MAG: MgtC/SapB family protein [Anaerolineae bacterium]|nr:MgtC/SapB family protein [Anaerolineae bacterium]
MSLQLQIEVSAWLLLASFLSVIIGLERERREVPAGLRTHMLVGIGACIFTILSKYAFAGSEPARVAAQVVSGIGFIGAGTILQRKRDIQHLTTAASIWATAAVGMAVGAGAWFLAIVSTLIIWFTLRVVRRLEPQKNNHASAIED